MGRWVLGCSRRRRRALPEDLGSRRDEHAIAEHWAFVGSFEADRDLLVYPAVRAHFPGRDDGREAVLDDESRSDVRTEYVCRGQYQAIATKTRTRRAQSIGRRAPVGRATVTRRLTRRSPEPFSMVA